MEQLPHWNQPRHLPSGGVGGRRRGVCVRLSSATSSRRHTSPLVLRSDAGTSTLAKAEGGGGEVSRGGVHTAAARRGGAGSSSERVACGVVGFRHHRRQPSVPRVQQVPVAAPAVRRRAHTWQGDGGASQLSAPRVGCLRLHPGTPTPPGFRHRRCDINLEAMRLPLPPYQPPPRLHPLCMCFLLTHPTRLPRGGVGVATTLNANVLVVFCSSCGVWVVSRG